MTWQTEPEKQLLGQWIWDFGNPCASNWGWATVQSRDKLESDGRKEEGQHKRKRPKQRWMALKGCSGGWRPRNLCKGPSLLSSSKNDKMHWVSGKSLFSLYLFSDLLPHSLCDVFLSVTLSSASFCLSSASASFCLQVAFNSKGMMKIIFLAPR